LHEYSDSSRALIYARLVVEVKQVALRTRAAVVLRRLARLTIRAAWHTVERLLLDGSNEAVGAFEHALVVECELLNACREATQAMIGGARA